MGAIAVLYRQTFVSHQSSHLQNGPVQGPTFLLRILFLYHLTIPIHELNKNSRQTETYPHRVTQQK